MHVPWAIRSMLFPSPGREHSFRFSIYTTEDILTAYTWARIAVAYFTNMD